jgi:membrane protein required for colicin V production
MNWVDYLIIAVIAVSALISLVRGFVREAVSIVVWASAFWLAVSFARPFAHSLARYIESPTLQIGVAFVAIFVGTLIVGALVSFIAGMLVGKTGLTGTDRAIGIVFGAARGLLLTGLLVLALGLTRMPQEPWWRDSVMIGWMQPMLCEFAVGEWMRGFTVYSPVAQGMPIASGRPATDYWADFCSGARPALTTDR